MPLTLKAALAALLLAAPILSARAEPPSAADLQSAYQMASQQRNEALDKIVGIGVELKRTLDSYEARLATAMEWLKDAQSKRTGK